jgi:hypothetical protein
MVYENEWNGTKLVFDISNRGDKTEVCFTRAGLWPDDESFLGCSSAWSSLIDGSSTGRSPITGEKQ